MRSPRFSFLAIALIFIFKLFNSGIAFGQTREIRLLEADLQKVNSDKEKVDLLNKLADRTYSHNFEQGVVKAKEALELASNIGYQYGKANALTLIGTYHYFKGENESALRFYHLALREKQNEPSEFPARTYIRLSIYYRQTAQFDSAQWYLDQIRLITDFSKSKSMLAAVLASQGLLDNAKSDNRTSVRNLRNSILLRIELKDSSRLADTWRNLGSVYTDLSQYDSADYCYGKAEELISQLHNPELEMLLRFTRGETSFVRGDFDRAIDDYHKALDIVKNNIYRRYYASLLYKIGELYENEGSYHSAFDFLFDALGEFEKLGARQDMAKVYSQIGWCYAYQENYDLAIDNANEALKLAVDIGDSTAIGQNRNLIGYLQYKKGDYKSALQNLEQAAIIRRKVGHWWGLAFTLHNLALTHEATGDHQKSFDLLYESLKIDERIGKKAGIVFTCNALGEQYLNRKDFANALVYLNRANALAKSVPIPPQLLVNYKHFINLYQLRGDEKSVIHFYEKYTALKDSLTNEASVDRISKSDALFQLRKKANEIELINKENELHQERIKTQEAEISFQRNIIFAVSIGLVMLVVLLTVIVKLLRANQNAKQILEKQNREITEQKEEIQAQTEELAESNFKLSMLNDELEARVQDRTTELNKSYNELETFLYRTSHDFRRPLTTYLGLVEVAKQVVNDNDVLDLWGKVKETTLGLDGMLLKLQSISSAEGASVTGIKTQEFTEILLKKYSEQIAERKIKIVVQRAADVIYSNPFLLMAAVENILENAINFSKAADAVITIKFEQADGAVTISVEDNGPGIAKEYQSKIFDMYYRASHDSKGNGLGLYIAKRAVTKLDGTIVCHSVLGSGSLFEIRLPVPS